ncbi:MAG TPA: PQQ-binding-like beta-propeller repeat protein [Tepidisphaeraceae bacterium]|nr:PQQ-binding-like beta-propeller repeat protein [Tepidisphaeraceae bacterium]
MQSLGVVPIFVSAGAAVLPTLVAAVTSVVAIILKPRELIRLCREKPMVVGMSVSCLMGICGLGWLIFTSPVRAARQNASQPPAHYDWAKVAEDILARQALAAIPTPATEPAKNGQAVVLGHDFSRASFDGNIAPIHLARLWSYQPEDTMFLSDPAVFGNRVYVAGCQSDLGGYTGLLACVDFETGKTIWETTRLGDELLKPFFSSPAITADGKNLIIGQGLHEDRDCALLCFDTSTGKLRWSVKTSIHIESSPAISGDIVVVGAGAIEGKTGKPTGDPGFVLAVRISDGKELWRQTVNDAESAPAIDETGMVYIGSGFNGNAVVALRSDLPEELQSKKIERIAWKTAVEVPVTGPITLAGELVISGGGNGDVVHSNKDARGLVTAMDRKTGQIKWQTPFEDSVLGFVAFRNDLLVCPIRNGEVVALSAKDGRVIWRTRVSGTSPVIAGCAFAESRIYSVSSDGYLAVLDAKDGKIIEKTYLNDQAKPGTGLTMSMPQVVNGLVIVGSETGGVRAYAGSGDAR